MVLVVYLILGVGLRVMEHGDGRGKLLDRPMETLALLSEMYPPHSWRATCVLQMCPLSIIALPELVPVGGW